MRIISGIYKGRQIPVRKNFPSRPTTDFAKENLFNILNNNFNFEELGVLDLFAGTGSISYEFASRGAQVDAIEKDHRSVSFIKQVIKDLNIQTITPIKTNVFVAIPRLKKSYDIVFADPPYDMPGITEIPNMVLNANLLNDEGWLILEHSEKQVFNTHIRFRETRKYGSVHFSIFV